MIVIYPGSFDPVTVGHIDIVRRGVVIASTLIVAVSDNPNKKHLFTVEERAVLLQKALANVPGSDKIEVASFTGLLADYAKHRGVGFILRGIRNAADYDNETPYAEVNRRVSGIETLFLTANPALSYVASRIVREAVALGVCESVLGAMVPPEVLPALKHRIANPTT